MIKTGILGAGAMGSGIAQVAAAAGHEVIVYDPWPASLAKGAGSIRASLKTLTDKQKISPEEAGAIFGRIVFAEDMEAFQGCGLVIEAIVEDLDQKQQAFRQLEAIVDEAAILATNTSSLSVSAIGAALDNPERILGIHFFNPAQLMRLVEIVPALQTAPEVLERGRAMIDAWGKTTVLAQDTPGFIVNRVARPYYGEALRILEEGIAAAPTIDWAMRELAGFKMGPFELMDFIGHDVNYTVTETVFRSFYYETRYRPSFTQKRLVDARYLGRKSGRGFYDYRAGAVRPEPVKEEQAGREIANRIVAMLINEAADALYLRIASRDDIDRAMQLGVNYPKGLLAWADEWGIEQVVATLDFLYAEYLEDRYRCCRLLRKMQREGKRFYE